MKEMRKGKFSIEPLRGTIAEGGNVQDWFKCFEEESKIKGFPKEMWGLRLLELLDVSDRKMLDITIYETSKSVIMKVYHGFKTSLRQVFEIEEEHDSGAVSNKTRKSSVLYDKL